MPVDSKRFTGPEDSTDYRVFMQKKPNPLHQRKGRGNDEQRKVYLKTGVISHAKGSAYVEQGHTKVMVGVYGPREIQKRSDFTMKGLITCEFKFAPFSCPNRRSHQADAEELELGLLLKECLESTIRMNLYPKSCIDVFVTVLEDGGGALASAITATGLALADAQIAMYDNLVGASASVHKDKLLVDPSLEEESSPTHGGTGEGNITIGYLNTVEQVVCMVSQGVLSPENYNQALDLAIKQCGILLPAIQQCQVEAFKLKLKEQPQP
eukprot:TRINITY_DN30164_c0_g1_i1.p1 TRINITY_DN30164_c0_g1~~TRINITY_DN30164_c0_g1_i1.p1  ORF type:complete len:267 (-),score=26.89 TRINITY_DN30164_c0_g1_i1:104-904(-)